jgi:hypothetical protein
VSLVEYTPAGTLVQTVAVPATGGNQLTLRGNSTSEGMLSLSNDGTIVTFGGYRADTGVASVNGTTSAATNRVIGALNLNTEAVNTNLGLSDSHSGQSFRSVGAIDANTFYTSGATSSMRVVVGALPATPTTGTSTQLTTATNLNIRQVAAFNGNLFVASGSATPGQTINQVGTGLPNTGSQTTAVTFPAQGATNQYNSFL